MWERAILTALHVKVWNTGVEPAPDAFSFTPPTGAEKLSPDALIELDELPRSDPTGENQ